MKSVWHALLNQNLMILSIFSCLTVFRLKVDGGRIAVRIFCALGVIRVASDADGSGHSAIFFIPRSLVILFASGMYLGFQPLASSGHPSCSL